MTHEFNDKAASAFTEQLDAENQSRRTTPIPVPDDGGGADENPIDYLINRVIVVVHESAQMGTEPLTTIASVLAQLYQAKALRDIAEQMREIKTNGLTFESVRFHRNRRSQRRTNPRRFADRSFADILRDLADAAEDR